jgi:hypothetical protein
MESTIDTNVYPSDSASQVHNTHERDERYRQSLDQPDDSNDQEEMTQESQAEIATRLRDTVVKYMGTCDKLKKVLAAARDLRKDRKTLERDLITDMKRLDVENLKLREGQLVAKRSTPKVPLTKSSVTSALSKNIGDPKMVEQIMDILYNKRDRYEKVEIAHYSNKQK